MLWRGRGGESGWVEERAARGRGRDPHSCPVSLPLVHPGACRLVCGDLCSSPQLGVDVWHLGFPLVPIPNVPRNADCCEQCLRMHKLTTGIQPQMFLSLLHQSCFQWQAAEMSLHWTSRTLHFKHIAGLVLGLLHPWGKHRASQFMDFSVWETVQWNSVQCVCHGCFMSD